MTSEAEVSHILSDILIMTSAGVGEGWKNTDNDRITRSQNEIFTFEAVHCPFCLPRAGTASGWKED